MNFKCEYFELKKPIDRRELDKYYCNHEENMESECEFASCPLDYNINIFSASEVVNDLKDLRDYFKLDGHKIATMIEKWGKK